MHEVRDRRALLEEFGVGDVADLAEPARIQLAPHTLAGTDGHRALHHHNVAWVAADRTEPVDDGKHPRQVGVTGVAGGRVDRHDENVAGGDQQLQVQGEREATAVLGDQHLQARLVDRHLAGVEGVDLAHVDVADAHRVAEAGQAHPGDQPDVACADDPDARAAHPATAAGRPAATARTNATNASR